MKKNDTGEIITGYLRLRNPAYGTGRKTPDGDPEVDWSGCKTSYSDDNGFDLRNIEKNGKHYIEINLPKGTQLIRYGRETGKYTAPKGTRYEELSLPYIKSSVEFHEYRVIVDSITVYCTVNKGIVAPMFDCNGGGVQYFHLDGSIRKMVQKNILERV